MRDALDYFPNEKTAGLKERALSGLSQEHYEDVQKKKGSPDPGQRAIAGLAAGNTLLLSALPFVGGQFVLKPLAERGSIEWGSTPAVKGPSIGEIFSNPDFSNKAKFMGLFDVTGRDRPIGPHARDVEEKLRDISKTVDSFIEKHRLTDKGVKLNFRTGPITALGENVYEPSTKNVYVSKPSKEIVLHELGHAADFTGSRLGKLRATLGPILQTAAFSSVPVALLAGDHIKEQIPGTIDDKAIKFLQDHAVGVVGATLAATQLYPEAKASYLAIQHIKNVEGGAAAKAALAKLLPAWGTYALSTIPIFVGLALAKKYMNEARREKADVIKTASEYGLVEAGSEYAKDLGHVAKQIGSGVIDVLAEPGTMRRIAAGARSVGTSPAFVTGALASALPATMGALYMYSTPSGKIIRNRMTPVEKTMRAFPPGAKTPEDEAKRERNPLAYAGMVGLGAALAGGVLTKMFSDLRAVL